MNKNVLLAAAIVLVLAGGGWYLLQSQYNAPSTSPVSQVTPTPAEPSLPSATEGVGVNQKTVVKISADGFSPQTITIKAGETVNWENEDTADHTVNSAPHPQHTDYPPLNLGVMASGENKSLTFTKAGTYKYHDHLNPSLFGSVTVE